jgi:hypothetical protein
MSVLFEQVVDPTSLPRDAGGVGTLIALSELLRRGTPSAYARALHRLIEVLRQHPAARLLRQPVFEWESMQSPCFRFELHRAWMQAHDAQEQTANTMFAAQKYAEAADAFDALRGTVVPLLHNLRDWTALSPELRRAPPFQPAFLLSLLARARCRAHHARFLPAYTSPDTGIETWKYPAAKPHQQLARRHAELACRYCTLANLLWARPGGVCGITTAATDFEQELVRQYHRVASYCASNFQTRLDHADACADHFEDCREVLALNTRLYYLTPARAAPPPPADMHMLLQTS